MEMEMETETGSVHLMILLVRLPNIGGEFDSTSTIWPPRTPTLV